MITILYQIFDKLQLILLLSLTLYGLEKSGFINLITRPISYIKSMKLVLIFWFLVGSIVSSVFTDLTAAAILLPLLLSYLTACKIYQNKELLITALVFGICAGGDITMYGGGDNLVAAGLFKTQFGMPFTNLMWTEYILPPTLIIMAIIAIILCCFIVPEKVDFNYNEVSHVDIFSSVVLLLEIGLVFANYGYVSWLLLLIVGIKLKAVKGMIANAPYKAMTIWTVCFLAGKIIGDIFKLLPLELISNCTGVEYIIAGVAAFMTIFCTNTMTASALIGITYSMFGPNLPVIALVMKSINVGYLTVYHNTCLSLANGYGLTQKKLFKYGMIVLIPQLLVNVIWYWIC